MPIDPWIARGYQGGIVNSFLDARLNQQEQARRDAMAQSEIANRNALTQQRQQEYADQQAADAEEEARWNAAYGAKDWGAMAQIDPQTTRLLWDFEQAKQPKAPYQIQTQPGPYGSRIVTDGSRFQVIDAPKPTGSAAAAEQYRTMSPEEAKGAGLPAGTVAQVGPNGKVDVISKPVQQELTPKDASAARVKLRNIAIAKRQLALVRQRYEALKDTFSAGPGGNYIPTVKGKAFDAAVNSMRDNLTSITRVPGIGAMSDFETRLAQAKFPDRGQYEDVGAQQIQSLQDLLDGLEAGYSDMLSGDSQGTSQSTPQPPPQQRRRYNPQTGKIE